MRRARPGFVLLAVLVVVAAAILVATGAIFTARATTSVARASANGARLREAALDGVALVADRLAREREGVLRGATPQLEEALFIRGEGEDAIEVTLAPMASGAFVESEGAKLDANRIDPAALARLAADLDPEEAALLETLARSRPLASLDGVVTALPESERLRALRALLGPLRTLEVASDRAERQAAGLVSLLGVHAREALVDNEGAPRLDVVDAFTDSEGTAFPTAAVARFSDAEVAALREVAKAAPQDDGRLAASLLARGIAVDRVVALLGLCTVHSGALAPARLDLLRADRKALAAIEGIGPEAAERIVELRTTLDAGERESTSWLVSRRVLEADAFASVAGRISHRSTSWRFRVLARPTPSAAGEDPDAGRESVASGPVAAFDCIVDVATEAPRIVLLRDVSMLPTARALALSLVERASAGRVGADPEPDAAEMEIAERSSDRVESVDETSDDVADADVELAMPARSTLERPRDSATMELPVRRPVRPRTDPTGRDVSGGAERSP